MLTACQSGLYLVNQEYMDERVKTTKRFDINEFDTYVYNICEDFVVRDKDSLLTRFCDCPEDFFNPTKYKNLKKVEEIYLLKHKTSNLVLYLTTFSHKYIRKGSGFLNDSTIYKDKIILDQVESIYIGNVDRENHKIYFKGTGKRRDITFYFDPAKYPNAVEITKGNMATAENNYSIKNPIPLDAVFANDVRYIKKDYTIDYYKRHNYKTVPHHVSMLNIIADEDNIEVVFSFSDFEEHYKLAAKRILYHPNFETINKIGK